MSTKMFTGSKLNTNSPESNDIKSFNNNYLVNQIEEIKSKDDNGTEILNIEIYLRWFELKQHIS